MRYYILAIITLILFIPSAAAGNADKAVEGIQSNDLNCVTLLLLAHLLS